MVEIGEDEAGDLEWPPGFSKTHVVTLSKIQQTPIIERRLGMGLSFCNNGSKSPQLKLN